MSAELDTLREQLQATLGDGYVVQRELGGGGMSRVFLAQETALGRTVVVKVMAPAVVAVASCERFAREVQLAARLQHPNIVPVLAASHHAGVPYYTMPYVRGESLRSRLASATPMPIPEAVSILRDVARALAYAHDEGIVHRDIKPENVLLSGDIAMVADFGVAKALLDARDGTAGPLADRSLTNERDSLGTPAYMAPEQVAGERTLDHRADIYAWGLMGWEMLAGHHPFEERVTASAMLKAQLADEPLPLGDVRPDVPHALADVIMACLEKNPDDRPASAQALLVALEGARAASGEATGAGAAGAASAERRPWLGIAAGGVALLLVLLTVRLIRRPDSTPTPGAPPSSIAVLPFGVAAGDTANRYFAEGIADELATALARVPTLRLAGRRSAARFAGSASTSQEIGRALDVGAVLEGTVRRAAERVRVTAELTSTRDGSVLWSDTFERDAHDVFAVQNDIARAIASALRLRLADTAKSTASSGGGAGDLGAYDLYWRGLFLLRRRGPALVEARTLFEQAVARDPAFARAHAALATTLLASPYFLPVPMGSVLSDARAAAMRALALDDRLPEAHTAMGFVHAESFEWLEAESEYRRALELDANHSEALYRLGALMVTLGRAPEAVPILERCKAIDPLYAIAASYLGWAYELQGRPQEAIAEGRRALALEPTGEPQLNMLGNSYGAAGRQDSAAALAERVLRQTTAPMRLGAAARLLALAGRTAPAKEVLRKLEALPRGTWGRETGLALTLLGLGDTARALDAMERAAAGDGDLLLSSVSLRAASPSDLWAQPRYVAVMRRFHLAPPGSSGGRAP